MKVILPFLAWEMSIEIFKSASHGKLTLDFCCNIFCFGFKHIFINSVFAASEGVEYKMVIILIWKLANIWPSR